MHFELWDTDSGNLLDDFASEADALEAVRSLIALNGPDAMVDVSLVSVSDVGRSTQLAAGRVLRELAEHPTSESTRTA
jgi:hypothetical protein